MIDMMVGVFNSLFGAFGIAVMIFLIFGSIAITGLAIWWYRLHTIDMVVHDEANDTTRPAGIVRARFTERQGIPCIRFMSWWLRKHIAPIPDKRAVHISKSGRWFITSLRKAGDQYTYIHIDPSVNDKVKGIDTNSKMLYLKNYAEANKRKKLTWQEALPIISNSIAFIVLVIILIVMVPTLFDKYLQILGTQADITEKQSSSMTILAQACTNTQFIQSNTEFLALANDSLIASPVEVPN